MGGSNKKVTFTIDFQAQTNSLQGQVDKMQKMLNGLKMPEELTQSTKQGVDALLERIKKVKEYTENNSFNLMDEPKIQKELNAIEKDFKHLVERVNTNAKNIRIVDNKAATALNAILKQTKDSIDAATASYNKQKLVVKQLKAELSQMPEAVAVQSKKEVKDQLDAELKLKKASYEEALKLRDEAFAKYTAKGHSEKQAAVYFGNTDEGKEALKVIKDYEDKNKQLVQAQEALEVATAQYNIAAKNNIEQLNQEKNKAEELKNALDQLKVEQLEKIKTTLASMQAEGKISLNFDPNDITTLSQLKEKILEIDKEDLTNVRGALKQLNETEEEVTATTHRMSEAAREDASSFKELDKSIEGMKTKAAYFFGITNALHLFRRAIKAAFNTVKDLDEVMTQTAVVTDFSVGDMWSQLPEYTRRANELGVSIHDAYEAATLYYQQGLKTNEVMAVSNETLKMARIAQLDAAEATSRMTNALRGFNMEINESNAQRVNDVYSELAAITAADTDEISRAMTKVASLAHNANMEFETTSAFLAQVIETTRESAETAGTALKTVIARFSEVKDLYSQGELMGTDEEGEEIDVNKVSVALRSAGINLNEYLTGAKGLDDIFIELASKWDKLDMVQQRYIATMAAGSRQQSRFIAMMSDYSRTAELVTAANTSAGASQKQFEKTLDSLKSKLAQLKNSWDTFLMGLADDTIIKVTIDLLKTLLDIVNKIFEGVDKLTDAYTGGAGGAVIRISALFLAFKLGNVIITQSIALISAHAKKKAEDAAATAGLAKEEAKEAGIKQYGLIVGRRSLLYSKQDVGAKGAQTVATKSLSAATLRLVYTTLAYTAAIVGLIAFIAGLVKLIDALSESSPSEIFKDAQKSTEAATSAANSLTTEYNNLKNSLDGLDEKYDSIENLTRGSQEWRDAVREVNEEVLNLMSNYDGLEIKNENGILKVANQKKVIDIYAKKYNDAQAARVGAQLHQTEAEKNVNYSNLEKQLYSEDYNFLEGYEPTKELIDKVAKNLVDSDLYGKTMDEIKVGVSSALHFSREVTDEDIKNLREYGKSLNELNQKTLAYSDTLAATAVANAKLVENTEEAAGSFMNANRLESLYIEEFNKLEGERFTNIQEQLAQALGFSNYGEYKQEHGEISGESARVQLAQIRAQEKATENVQVFSKNLSGLNKEVQKVYSRGDKLGLTQKDVNESLEAIGYDFSGNELQEAQKVRDYVRDLWDNLKPEVQDAFGEFVDFQKDYIEAIFGSYAALRDTEEEFKLFSGSIDGFKESLNAGSLKQLGLNLIDVFDASGSEAAKTIQDEISSIMNESLKDEQKAGFIDVLNSIDWSSVNSIETLDETLKGLGYDIPEKQLEKLVDDMIDLGGATYKVNFEHVTDQLEKIGGLASRIKSGEQTSAGFSLEGMETAVGAGISKSDFYYNPNDNTFTYIGNKVDDIYNALLEQTDILVGQDALERQVENAKAFDTVYNTNFKGNVDTSDATALEAFLRVYLQKSGENSLISEEAIDRRSGDVEGLKKLYDKLLENADNVKENTAALEAAKERADQTAAMMASIDENLAEGNLGAIQAKAKASGMDEDIYNALNANGIQSLGAATKEFMQAAEQGLDIDALNRYIKLLKKLNPELDTVLATQVAISNTKLNKGLQALIDSYDEWGTLIGEDGIALENLDSISSETWFNYKKNVNELLGINEDLADSFYASADTTRLLTELIGGEEAALYELRAAAAQQIWVDVQLNSEGLEEEFERQKDIINDFIVNEAPTMEIGTVINTGPFADALNWILKNTSLTVDSINTIFGGIGGFELEPVYGPPPGMSGYEYAKSGKQIIIGYKMKSNNAKTTGAYVGGPSKMTNYKSDSGSGGSSGSEKTDTWENPYDELYNLTEKINEALRTREALERRYEKLVKKTSSTVSEVTKGYYDQIRHLRTEADLQRQMQVGRARQLDNVANEMYMDSEGNRSSFASLGVTKYANYNKETGVITIDWEGLEALEGDPSKVAEGEAAEAYISRLEELQDQYEEVRDKLWDIEDEIERLREEAIESYLSFEDRVMDDLVNHYQNQIDELSNLYDAIDQSTNEIIKGIQEEINYSRQIRDNTKKEEDIADKEARLAYLRRDTSGANAMEIKKLEEDIANSREQYSDTMVDQQIADMQNEAQLAAEQRQHQIEIMQNQLDVAQKNGELWGKVWDLINTATAADGTFSQNSELVNLMKETEAFQSLSVVGQQKWWEDAAEAFLRAQTGLSEAEGKYGVDANGDGSVSSASSSASSSAGSSSGSTSGSGSDISTEGAGHFAKVGTYEHPMAQMPSNEVKELQQALNDAGFTDNEGNALKTDGIYGSRTRQAVWKLQEKLENVKVDGYYGPETRSATLKSQFKAYATGGLADFTGPAWLDGTKSSPELVLNAKDTENFIALKNILANLLGGQGGDLIGNKGGDNYFDIHIDAEIGSDYDVDRLAEKIEKKIYEKSSYRNVNAINYLR